MRQDIWLLIASFVKQQEAIIIKTFHKFGSEAKLGREHSSANVMTFCFNFYKALLSLLT